MAGNCAVSFTKHRKNVETSERGGRKGVAHLAGEQFFPRLRLVCSIQGLRPLDSTEVSFSRRGPPTNKRSVTAISMDEEFKPFAFPVAHP
jgi:hypothetical protein